MTSMRYQAVALLSCCDNKVAEESNENRPEPTNSAHTEARRRQNQRAKPTPADARPFITSKSRGSTRAKSGQREDAKGR